jgi:hypothetical protein
MYKIIGRIKRKSHEEKRYCCLTVDKTYLYEKKGRIKLNGIGKRQNTGYFKKN